MATVGPDNGSDDPRLGNIPGGDDPGTVVALIYRITGDPARALTVGLLGTLAGSLAWLLTNTTPVGMVGTVVGGISGGVLLAGVTVYRVLRTRPKK